MPLVGSQSKLRPKSGLAGRAAVGSTTMVEQPMPLDRSAMVLAKRSNDGSRPDAFAAASISVAMCAREARPEFARGKHDRRVVLVLLRVLEEPLVKSGEVRRVGDGQLAELLAHLGRLAAHDQHRHPSTYRSSPLPCLPGRTTSAPRPGGRANTRQTTRRSASRIHD